MWEIKRENLLPVLELINMVSDKQGIPSSEYFWVRGKGDTIKMSLSSLVSGEVILEGHGEWPFKDDFYLDRRVFMPFVNAARELKDKNTFQFTKNKKQLIVTHGKRKAAFDSQHKVKGYGNLARIVKQKRSSIPITDDVRKLLTCGKNCAVSDSVVPHLNCVYITKGKGGLSIESYASNDKMYYLGTGKLEGKIKTSIPFPLHLISLLDSDGLRKVSWMGKYVVLKFKHGVIWQPINEEALTDFPKKGISRRIVSADKLPVTFTASNRRLARLMVRLGSYLQSVRRRDWVVGISGKKNEWYLKVSTKIPGSVFYEKLSVSTPLKRDFKMQWPLDILEPVFEFLSTKNKKVAVIVRRDEKHGLSYITTGNYWIAVTSQQE